MVGYGRNKIYTPKKRPKTGEKKVVWTIGAAGKMPVKICETQKNGECILVGSEHLVKHEKSIVNQLPDSLLSTYHTVNRVIICFEHFL
jgi:hypothetical protein